MRRACIAAVEEALRATPDADLARAVERLSDLYTTRRGALVAEQADATHLAAKREYFLASDAPKVGLVLDECAARSAVFLRLAQADEVRVADLGAGTGATSTGFVAWIAGMCARLGCAAPRVRIHAVELGAPAAAVLAQAVRAAAAQAGMALELVVEARDFRSFDPKGFDLLLSQTALNELLVGQEHEAATTAMVARWAEAAPLVVIEPALRPTTRALMALRDALAAGGRRIVGPCLHARPCPLRARTAEWCHESRRIEPTPRVAAIDRIVGRRDARALYAWLATEPTAAPQGEGARPIALRVLTDPLGSRGKTERLVCRADGELRTMRLLDREQSASNRMFLDAPQGADLTVDPLPDNDRIAPAAVVARAADAGSSAGIGESEGR
ncbi:MAG: small ribosomal subunit Rsm22 family protein [Planctomycetota bacterium]